MSSVRCVAGHGLFIVSGRSGLSQSFAAIRRREGDRPRLASLATDDPEVGRLLVVVSLSLAILHWQEPNTETFALGSWFQVADCLNAISKA